MNIKEEIILCKEGDVLRAKMSGEIDHHVAKRIRDVIDKELFGQRPSGLVLDFSSVRFMDSSGIGLIIGRAEVCGELRISIRLTGLSPTLKKLINLSGVDRISNITVSV